MVSVNRDEAAAATNANFPVFNDIPDDAAKSITESDAQIAHILQMQFNKEYDNLLAKREQKINGTSKVSISFDKYKISRQWDEGRINDEMHDFDDLDDEHFR